MLVPMSRARCMAFFWLSTELQTTSSCCLIVILSFCWRHRLQGSLCCRCPLLFEFLLFFYHSASLRTSIGIDERREIGDRFQLLCREASCGKHEFEVVTRDRLENVI